MYYIIIGLLIGVLVGLNIPFHIPEAYSLYTGVGLLAALDSVFGGIKSKYAGSFDAKIFISGFFGNSLIAVGLVYAGNRLDMDLYLAAVVVFGSRLFANFAEIRRYLLKFPLKSYTIKKINKPQGEASTEADNAPEKDENNK